MFFWANAFSPLPIPDPTLSVTASLDTAAAALVWVPTVTPALLTKLFLGEGLRLIFLVLISEVRICLTYRLTTIDYRIFVTRSTSSAGRLFFGEALTLVPYTAPVKAGLLLSE